MNILLAVDSSAASQVAAREAASRPWPTGTKIEILSVVENPEVLDISGLDLPALATAQEVVRCASSRFHTAGISVSTKILRGDPKTVVLDQAAVMDADLIIVGSHEESEFMRFLLGSVARAVVRFAPCSVEIVRAVSGPGPMKVLLATDGSACSEVAARSIAARPWPAGAEIRVLSVVELQAAWFRTPYPAYFDHAAMESLRGDAMKKAQEAIMAAEQIIGGAGLIVSGTVAVPSATVKEMILNEAINCGADLIVMGSHGRRGASRFLLGSASEPVAFHAPCSVEIIRQTLR